MKRTICAYYIKVDGFVVTPREYYCYEDAEDAAKKAATQNPNRTVTVFMEVAKFKTNITKPELVRK